MRVAGPPDDRIGRRLGAVHGAGAPVEAVRAGIGGQDQQPPAVGGPGNALRRPRERPCQHGLGAGHERVRELVAGGDPVGQKGEPRPIRRPHRRLITRVAVGQPRRRAADVGHVEIGRSDRSRRGYGRVERERDPRAVGRDRELCRGADVQQSFRRRQARRLGVAHGAAGYTNYDAGPRRRRATRGVPHDGGRDGEGTDRGRRAGAPGQGCVLRQGTPAAGHRGRRGPRRRPGLVGRHRLRRRHRSARARGHHDLPGRLDHQDVHRHRDPAAA